MNITYKHMYDVSPDEIIALSEKEQDKFAHYKSDYNVKFYPGGENLDAAKALIDSLPKVKAWLATFPDNVSPTMPGERSWNDCMRAFIDSECPNSDPFPENLAVDQLHSHADCFHTFFETKHMNGMNSKVGFGVLIVHNGKPYTDLHLSCNEWDDVLAWAKEENK